MSSQIQDFDSNYAKRTSVDERLRNALEIDLLKNEIVISPRNKINLTHYAKIIGCSRSRLAQLTDVLEEYEGQIPLVYVKPEPRLAKELRSLLDADANAGDVPVSRGGKINRRHYAAKLGCNHTSLTPFIPIFKEFEQKLDVSTGPMRHLPNMRAWLKESFAARELGIRDGRIDRVALGKRFGLRGGTFITRHPEIRALVEEYDARVALEGYLPAAQVEELDRLRNALAAGPELNRDRITINLMVLSATANVPQGRFRDRQFAEAISTTQNAITLRAKASKIDPFFHDRVFWFSGLVVSWGNDFVERAAVRFKQVISGVSANSSKQLHLTLLNALEWMGASDNSHCQAIVNEARERGRITDAGEWEDALFAYRDHLIAAIPSGSVSHTSVSAIVGALRTGLEALASGGVVPKMAILLPGVRNSRRRGRPLRSVAEAPVTGRAANDYVAFVREHFEFARKALKSDQRSVESEAFFVSIGQSASTAADLPDDPATAVKVVLERRLDALHKRATEIVKESEIFCKKGQQLIENSKIECEEFKAHYVGKNNNSYKKRIIVKGLFPANINSQEEIERGTANLLKYIDDVFGGIAPTAAMTNSDYGSFFLKRYENYGGVSKIESMLVPDANAVGAVLTLYLIESGANVSVGRTLKRDCSQTSDLEGHRRITGYKARAGGKPIIVDLPDDAPSVRAIDWLLSAGRRFPEHVENLGTPESDEDRLFLMRMQGRVQLMTPTWYTNWFKKFAASIPDLAALSLTPNMIRPSVLLHASLSNDGRLLTGMAWAQHSHGVTQGYQQKWPTRQRYDEMIRQFLVSFESLVMKNVPEAADKLGITAEEFELRLGNLQATGLGTFCIDGRGRPGAESASCSTVDCWNDCPHMLIVAEVEAIASLQLWQAALRHTQPEMERDQPERWDEVWLPWLCLTDVVEEKMARGPMTKIWNAARKRASEISSQPSFVPPKPW